MSNFNTSPAEATAEPTQADWLDYEAWLDQIPDPRDDDEPGYIDLACQAYEAGRAAGFEAGLRYAECRPTFEQRMAELWARSERAKRAMAAELRREAI